MLLLTGFAGSGIAMFVLARHVTGATGPALVAAAVFTLAPYRIEHVMHLELQWAMWVPLTFWALHRAIDDRSWRFGVLAGLVFLAADPVVRVLRRLSGDPARRVRPAAACWSPAAGRSARCRASRSALAVAVVLRCRTCGRIFSAARAVGGARSSGDRALQRAADQLSVGNLAQRPLGLDGRSMGRRELRLFPGADCGRACAVQRRQSFLEMDVPLRGDGSLLAIELSFGTNGTPYRWLSDHVARTARISFGVAFCDARDVRGRDAGGTRHAGDDRTRTASLAHQRQSSALILALLLVDYANRPMPLSRGRS